MLNISELVKKREDKREYWKRKYDQVLEKCHKRIKYYAKHGFDDCYFEVPQTLFGLPVYDIHECLHYIVMKLKRNGFDLELIGTKIIHIGWKKYISQEPKYIQTARKIKEANKMLLLPPPPRPLRLIPQIKSKGYYVPELNMQEMGIFPHPITTRTEERIKQPVKKDIIQNHTTNDNKTKNHTNINTKNSKTTRIAFI